MLEPTLMLLQSEGSATGIFRFFAAFLLIVMIYGGAWGFTYWISKDE